MSATQAEHRSSINHELFTITDEMKEALRSGARLSFGTDHAGYPYETNVSAETRKALLDDFII